MTAFATELEARLRAAGAPERAEWEKRYLKSDLRFLGATARQVEAAVKELSRDLELDHDRLVALAEELWARPIHECRAAAVMLLDRHVRLLDVADLALIERLVRDSGTWALVDALAGGVVARMVATDPDPLSPVMDRWAGDPDFWLRRSSLLAELRVVRAGQPLDRFLARAERMLDEREFFIRKAIGWVLREAGRRRPEEVAAWLAPRTHRASGVTMREAVKYLPHGDGVRLMGAYRAKRPAT